MACKERNDYAIYQGDKFLFLGKARECAKFLDIELTSFRFLAAPVYRKRLAKRNKSRNPLIVIKVEDDE